MHKLKVEVYRKKIDIEKYWLGRHLHLLLPIGASSQKRLSFRFRFFSLCFSSMADHEDFFIAVTNIYLFSLTPFLTYKVIVISNGVGVSWFRVSHSLTKVLDSSFEYGKNPSWKGYYPLRYSYKLSQEISPLAEGGGKLLVVGPKNRVIVIVWFLC